MWFENYSDSSDALFSLIQEVKLGYQMTEEPPKRGRKPDFSDLSFLLLAVVAVETLDVFRLRTASSFAKGRAASGGFGFSQSRRIGRGLCGGSNRLCRLLKNRFPCSESRF